MAGKLVSGVCFAVGHNAEHTGCADRDMLFFGLFHRLIDDSRPTL